jgi:hypothetical protein
MIGTVHQGDRDGIKGLYHVNSVDEVTQWEIVGAVPFISEQWLIPLLEPFPFRLHGLHSGNGKRVHQSHRRAAAPHAADRTNQAAARPQQRQRPGGIKEPSGDPQTDRLRGISPATMPRP